MKRPATRTIALSAAMLACLTLVGCPEVPTRTSGTGKTNKPSTKRNPATPEPTGTAGARVALPSTVRLALPSALNTSGVISAGGLNVISSGRLNVIGAGGGNVIGAGGGNVIGAGGGNVIDAGGLNYQVQAVSLAGLKVIGSLYQYETATRALDQLLNSLATLPLKPDQPLTFEDSAGKVFTALLTESGGGKAIALGTGRSATGESQIAGVSFTSEKQGRAVWHHTDTRGKWYFATTFDLEAGRVTADGASDMPLTPESQTGYLDLGHWEFERQAGRSFSFKEWTYARKVDQPGTGEAFVALANFTPEEQGAMVFGTRSDDGEFFFFKSNLSDVDPVAPHDHYIDKDQAEITREAAPAALKAMLPSDEAFKAFAPVDPGAGDPFSKPVFAFPK